MTTENNENKIETVIDKEHVIYFAGKTEKMALLKFVEDANVTREHEELGEKGRKGIDRLLERAPQTVGYMENLIAFDNMTEKESFEKSSKGLLGMVNRIGQKLAFNRWLKDNNRYEK